MHTVYWADFGRNYDREKDLRPFKHYPAFKELWETRSVEEIVQEAGLQQAYASAAINASLLDIIVKSLDNAARTGAWHYDISNHKLARKCLTAELKLQRELQAEIYFERQDARPADAVFA